MPKRGLYQFETDVSGNLVDSRTNFGKSQRMFVDWNLVLTCGGPGTRSGGRGSWHVLCHLVAAAGLFRDEQGRPGWAGITYDSARKSYVPTFSHCDGPIVKTVALKSTHASEAMKRHSFVGYVEGASRGHILDRKAKDPGDPKKDDRRQDYDHPVYLAKKGGPVWEHWCTTRDIATSDGHGAGVLRSYLTLVSVLGGRFSATVTRGRIDHAYGHLLQLRAMARAGWITCGDALWDVEAVPIPKEAELLFHEARPKDILKGAAILPPNTSRGARYFMYSRKIASFTPIHIVHELFSSV